MTPDRRRELEARRAELRAKLATDRVRQWMRDNYTRARFGPQPIDRAEQIYQALGR